MKHTEKKEGFFVEFCPVCRKFSLFQLYRIGRARSFFGNAIGEGDLVGHDGKCQVCGTQIQVEVKDYRSFYVAPDRSISNLIRDTFPNIREVRASRLALERRIRENALEPGERKKLLLEPFYLFAKPTRQIFEEPARWSTLIGLSLLATLVIVVIVLMIGSSLGLPGAIDDRLGYLALVIFLAGVWVTGFLMIAESKRRYYREILPTLAKGLRPLNPSQEDLAACLDELKRAGAVIGKKTKLELLWAEIARVDQPAS